MLLHLHIINTSHLYLYYNMLEGRVKSNNINDLNNINYYI